MLRFHVSVKVDESQFPVRFDSRKHNCTNCAVECSCNADLFYKSAFSGHQTRKVVHKQSGYHLCFVQKQSDHSNIKYVTIKMSFSELHCVLLLFFHHAYLVGTVTCPGKVWKRFPTCFPLLSFAVNALLWLWGISCGSKSVSFWAVSRVVRGWRVAELMFLGYMCWF